MVVAAQARRYRTGVWKLVIRTFAKAHRTGHDRSVEFGRHECYHGTRVHAPAQKGPQRHIAAEPDADRLAKDLPQLVPQSRSRPGPLVGKGRVQISLTRPLSGRPK